MTKWKRRLLIAAIAGLVVCLIVLPIVDRVWFALSAPSAYDDARWRGEWNSEEFLSVSGRIIAKLPDPIPRDQEFDVDALVYYRITSLYRTGCAVPMKMVGYLPSGGSGGGSGSVTPTRAPPRMTFKLKGDDPSKQSIDYVATTDDHVTLIVGGYRSTSPYDMGRFVLAYR